jgi:hypothetical protein
MENRSQVRPSRPGFQTLMTIYRPSTETTIITAPSEASDEGVTIHVECQVTSGSGQSSPTVKKEKE